jgi:hypothetical protein
VVFPNHQIALELGANEHVVGRVRNEYHRLGIPESIIFPSVTKCTGFALCFSPLSVLMNSN